MELNAYVSRFKLILGGLIYQRSCGIYTRSLNMPKRQKQANSKDTFHLLNHAPKNKIRLLIYHSCAHRAPTHAHLTTLPYLTMNGAKHQMHLIVYLQ